MGDDVSPRRIARAEILRRVASDTGMSVSDVRTVYGALLEEIVSIVADGDEAILYGFGRFYSHTYPGQSVTFGDKGETGPFTVLKFSASRETNKSLERNLL